MRISLVLIFVLGLSLSFAQVFHVADTSALLIKTVNQSPAHWYIEVFSDITVDTALRWKATHFDNVPPEWEILMDDQSHTYSHVQVGDSADFDLPANQAFARKLIIGAVLNGTPGHGICYFDVYDPDHPAFRQTISYEFVVTDATSGMTEFTESSFLEWVNGSLRVKANREAQFNVYDLSGKGILQNKLTHSFDFAEIPESGVFLIQVILDHQLAIVKIYK